MRFAPLFLVLAVLTGVSAAQNANVPASFPAGPQYLSLVGPDFLRPIATPSLDLNATLPPIPGLPQIGPVVENQSYISNSELANQADLFPIYYGYPMVSVIELTGPGPSEVPESIASDGVTRIVNPQSLRQMGYGISLGEHAAYWKSQQPQATHVYTNSDIGRLRQ